VSSAQRKAVRTVVVVLVTAAAVAGGEVVAWLLAVVSSSEFGWFLISMGVAVPIALRLDWIDNDRGRRDPPATPPVPRPRLPRQRVKEGAS
jgi:hypothetical protein